MCAVGVVGAIGSTRAAAEEPAVSSETGPWSHDGSAELVALRSLPGGSGDPRAHPGTRGIVIEVAPEPVAASLSALEPGQTGRSRLFLEADYLRQRYELERSARRGRRLFKPATILVSLGALLTIGCFAGLGSALAEGDGLLPIAILTGASNAILGVGIGLMVRGIRRRKHPESFALFGTPYVPRSPPAAL